MSSRQPSGRVSPVSPLDPESIELEQNSSLLPHESAQTRTANSKEDSRATISEVSTASFRSWRNSWWPESLSIIGAACCLAGIIIILADMNNKLLSSWTSPVSLNTSISILSTVFKVLLALALANCISQAKWLHYQKPRNLGDMNVFDFASRGPGGSFLFLLRRRTLMTIATLGAISTILLLPVDPFTQQLVQPVLRSTPLNHATAASFGYTTNYDSGTTLNQFSQTDAFKADLTIQGAVLNGLYDTNLATPFSCPSGECVWNNTFTMLGFQSVCDDVSKKLLYACDPPDPFDGSVTQICNLTTPGQNSLQLRWVPADSRTAIAVNATSPPRIESASAQAQRANITRLVTFAVYRMWDLDSNFKSMTPPETIECHIDIVGKAWSGVAVHKNQFHVGKTDILPLRYKGVSTTSGRNIVVLDSAKTSQIFQVNLNDLSALSDFLRKMVFSGNISAGNGGTDPSFMVARLYNRTVSIDSVAEQITKSMENRLGSLPTAQRAMGQVLLNQTFIHIRWPWITLHVLLLVLCLVFLVIISLQAASRRSTLFKGSSLALLATRMHPSDGLANLQQGPKVMHRDAEKLMARFTEDYSFRVYPRSA